ncbi:ABC transporter permease [uncultured Negativibacillus sp.]|uniref:ABC transporter permease n=1 Tax=uncultured Negativibacillus sp. TaxID=1980696 RepID=UPI0025CD3E19|nr:ABC transporter permease [uncultured Negativibacillus sp.]
MIKYTIKRLLQSIVTVLIIVTIVFLLLRMLPTDYYFTEEQLMKFTEEQKNEQLLAAGLLDPIPVQLFRFYGDLLHFDLGESRRIQNGVPVEEVIGGKFAISMRLGLTSLAISLVIGVAVGILQTRHKDRLFDHIGTAYTIFVNAVPGLVSYSLVLIFGSRVLGLPSMYSSRNPGPSSILPIVCLAMTSIAYYALWTRRYMIDELNKDYIKLARVKGMSTKTIMVRHVLRNAFVPIAQYLPASMLLTIGGSLLVERFFSVPGMGPLLTDSISRYDTNIVQALVILYASLGILGVFLGDVLMMIIDPRITLASKGGSR